MTYLAPESLDKILARVDPVFLAFITLSADTGCRRGELHAILWEDVSFTDRAITVRRSKTGDTRRIPMTPCAFDTFQGLASLPAPTPIRGSTRVFSRINSAKDPSAVSKAFKRAALAAGFTTLRLHDLRHAFASGLARAGATPGVIGTLLGDKTPSVVFRYSKHAPKSAEAEAVDLLAMARGQTPSGSAATAAHESEKASIRRA